MLENSFLIATKIETIFVFYQQFLSYNLQWTTIGFSANIVSTHFAIKKANQREQPRCKLSKLSKFNINFATKITHIWTKFAAIQFDFTATGLANWWTRRQLATLTSNRYGSCLAKVLYWSHWTLLAEDSPLMSPHWRFCTEDKLGQRTSVHSMAIRAL